jgi:hypothetical protein
MLAAFASYERAAKDHSDSDATNIMQQYPGTRLYRIVLHTRIVLGAT